MHENNQRIVCQPDAAFQCLPFAKTCKPDRYSVQCGHDDGSGFLSPAVAKLFICGTIMIYLMRVSFFLILFKIE